MTCFAIDGDTLDCQGVRRRLVDFDAPELHRPLCAAEAALALQAKHRLQALLDAGAVIITVPCRYGRTDNYGRECAVGVLDGESVADIMLESGLGSPIWPRARTFRKKDWCK